MLGFTGGGKIFGTGVRSLEGMAAARSGPAAARFFATKAGALDRMAATQAPRNVGSVIPKSFNLTRSTGDKVWVNANATKHMWEETRRLTFGRTLAEDQRLNGLADAVDNAVVGNWEKVQVVNGWELIFSQPRGAGLNPVLKHARYLWNN